MRDKQEMSASAAPVDYYAQCAAEMFQIPVERVTRALRDHVKALHLLDAYALTSAELDAYLQYARG